MTEQERKRHRSKGIFTIRQVSYTFRPRRTPKRVKNPAQPHYAALQALAIRENTVYVHGTPVIPDAKAEVYLDIEGLPDRESYYLVGALIVCEGRETFHSFWASDQSQSLNSSYSWRIPCANWLISRSYTSAVMRQSPLSACEPNYQKPVGGPLKPSLRGRRIFSQSSIGTSIFQHIRMV